MENFITLLADDKTFVVIEGCITDKPDSFLAGLIKFAREKNINNNTIRLNLFPEELQILLEYHRNECTFQPFGMKDDRYEFILDKFNISKKNDNKMDKIFGFCNNKEEYYKIEYIEYLLTLTTNPTWVQILANKNEKTDILKITDYGWRIHISYETEIFIPHEEDRIKLLNTLFHKDLWIFVQYRHHNEWICALNNKRELLKEWDKYSNSFIHVRENTSRDVNQYFAMFGNAFYSCATNDEISKQLGIDIKLLSRE
jgi:hypothetical protein